ncbi:hypothetical protein LSTR_LSTR008069 [Laodelphax striatellus]|uniref:rRNA biogenesis protein RRP36 n=1 Tax=Laodelphax striatellus TaxID=195883 RepID=A0A482XMA1_LAOST|nr:hypothetical protein LSTR_LSTR008069 [Laodelphax striatellus]
MEIDEFETNLDDFKSQLSELTFEELIELKQKVGAKVYNEGIKPKNTKANDIQFNRANKNRPREMSSKIPPPRLIPGVKAAAIGNEKKNKIVARDPRFEDACGVYDEKKFKTNYKFLDKIRRKERKMLQKELMDTTDAERKTEKRLLELVDNYEQLKKSGKLNKHLERRMKKNNHKERKKFLQTN